MTESEEMASHSLSFTQREHWAFQGDKEHKSKLQSPPEGPGSVFYNRMLGFSDDGLRVLGKQCSDLPGGSKHNENEQRTVSSVS